MISDNTSQYLGTEKREQVNPEVSVNDSYILRAAVARGDGLILKQELVGCLFERLSAFKLACATFALEA
jgi:hypothetical protein